MMHSNLGVTLILGWILQVNIYQMMQKNARCSLHKWVGVETEKGVLYCRTCNVNLCQLCFKYYHVTKDIVGEKEKLKKKYTPKTKRKPKKKGLDSIKCFLRLINC